MTLIICEQKECIHCVPMKKNKSFSKCMCDYIRIQKDTSSCDSFLVLPEEIKSKLKKMRK